LNENAGANELSDRITEAIKSAIVKSSIDIYHKNGAFYFDPEAGHNAMTFGQQLNAGICKVLAERVENMPNVKVHRKRNTVDIVIDGMITLRPAKLGRSKQDDVWTSFPNSRKTAHRKAMNNLHFTPTLDNEEFDGPRDFFIGHFGDEDGCQAVYLCAPAVVGKERTLGWRLCVPLFIAGDDDTGATINPKDSGPVPPETDLDDEFGLSIKDTEDEEGVNE
jgi:hypothetical protein